MSDEIFDILRGMIEVDRQLLNMLLALLVMILLLTMAIMVLNCRVSSLGKKMNPQVAEALRQLRAAFQQSMQEANANSLALNILLQDKGLITDAEFGAARVRAVQIIDQMVAEMESQARAENLAAEMEARRRKE